MRVDFDRGEVRFQKPVLYHMRRPDGSPGWDRFQIRALRRHMRLTQKAFAELLGVPQPTVSYWETGRYVSTYDTNRRLTLLAQQTRFSEAI